MTPRPAALPDLLQGQVAREVLNVLVRGLTVHVRGDGHPVPWWAQPVCQALADVAETPRPAVGSASGTASESLEASTWAPVDEAAGLAGCSASYARRLARSGRIRARRVGSRSWLIDIGSLALVLGRTAA